MPSFRAQLEITGLRTGNAPEAVMDSAVAAVGAAHLVEANQLDVVGGVPRITVRFLVEDPANDGGRNQALRASANMHHAVEQVATTGRLRVLLRRQGRWVAA